MMGVSAAISLGAFALLVLFTILQRRRKRAEERLTDPDVVKYEVFAATVPKRRVSRSVVLTGGCGFVGRYLVWRYLSEKPDVAITVLDVSVPPEISRDPRVTYIRCNLLRPDHLKDALATVAGPIACVFHIAGLLPMVNVPDAALWAVNLEGTRNVIAACKAADVRALVYTSSATVCLERDNRDAIDCKEEDGYPQHPVDTYTASKGAAERALLEANSETLITCSLRPAAVFGRGDKMLADSILAGKSNFYLGKGEARIDWVSVESVVHAHFLVEQALSEDPEGPKRVAGRAYNIGGGEKLMYKMFFGGESDGGKSLWGLKPAKSIPLWIAKFLARVNVAVYQATGFVLFEPGFSPMGVEFTQRSYTFRSLRAKRDFGYQPLTTVTGAIARLVAAYAKEKPQAAASAAKKIK